MTADSTTEVEVGIAVDAMLVCWYSNCFLYLEIVNIQRINVWKSYFKLESQKSFGDV